MDYRYGMKKHSAKDKVVRRDWLLASCDETRRKCNNLTNAERQHYLDVALAIINGHDAKAPARSR